MVEGECPAPCTNGGEIAREWECLENMSRGGLSGSHVVGWRTVLRIRKGDLSFGLFTASNMSIVHGVPKKHTRI